MTADIDAQHLFFKSQLRALIEFSDGGKLHLKFLALLLTHEIKEGHLSRHIIPLVLLDLLKKLGIDAHQLSAGGAEAVKGTSLYEILQYPAVQLPLIPLHSGDKILQIPEGASGLSLSDHRIDDGTAHTFNGCQGIADAASGYGKSRLTLIDIRRQQRDVHAAAGQDIACHLGRKVDD